VGNSRKFQGHTTKLLSSGASFSEFQGHTTKLLSSGASFGGTGEVDQSVNAIVTAYDDVGRVSTVSSEGLVGSVESVLNQVEYAYDGWGNMIQEWQSPNGAVTTSTPEVQYQYADGASGGVAQYVRLTDLIYTNGRDVQYGYGTAGAVDDIMSRIGSISDSTGGLASYDYLGAGTVAGVS
jgi:YD repeat-containing protein